MIPYCQRSCLVFLLASFAVTSILPNMHQMASDPRHLNVQHVHTNLMQSQPKFQNLQKVNAGKLPKRGMRTFSPAEVPGDIENSQQQDNTENIQDQSNQFQQPMQMGGMMSPMVMSSMMAPSLMAMSSAMPMAVNPMMNMQTPNPFNQPSKAVSSVLRNPHSMIRQSDDDDIELDDKDLSGFENSLSGSAFPELRVKRQCESIQRQALAVANNLIKRQNKIIFSDLMNYVLKAKFLIGMTEIKLGRVLKKKFVASIQKFSQLTEDNVRLIHSDDDDILDDELGLNDEENVEETDDEEKTTKIVKGDRDYTNDDDSEEDIKKSKSASTYKSSTTRRHVGRALHNGENQPVAKESNTDDVHKKDINNIPTENNQSSSDWWKAKKVKL